MKTTQATVPGGVNVHVLAPQAVPLQVGRGAVHLDLLLPRQGVALIILGG